MPYRRMTMTMQADAHGFRRRKTVHASPEIDADSFVPVLMMSLIGLTLSLLIIALVAR
jgi:hypothetical protein